MAHRYPDSLVDGEVVMSAELASGVDQPGDKLQVREAIGTTLTSRTLTSTRLGYRGRSHCRRESKEGL